LRRRGRSTTLHPAAARAAGTADLTTGIASQVSDHPRLARLVQLANTHRCRGG